MLSLLLLTIPGMALYSRMKKSFSLPELAAASVALSIILIPFAAMLSRPLGLAPAIPLAVFVACLLYKKGGKALATKKDLLALASALFFAVLVFGTLSQFLVGPLVHPTHAGDAVWHMSNAQLYELAPQFPPEDSYSPGHFINANWLFTVLLGETSIHVLMALSAFALFLFLYLIAERLFRSGLAAGWLYMLFAGASWAIAADSTFQQLIFSPLGFKFDPTLLFFFLPQPQAIGLLLMAFALFLFFEKRHALLGLCLAALAGFHLQTAGAMLIALSLYHMLNRQRPVFLKWFAVGALPILAPLLQLKNSHIETGFQHGALPAIALTVLPLLALSWQKRKEKFLPLLALVCIALALFVAVPLTGNGYRFLVYSLLPLAVLASPSLKRPFPLVIAAMLCISSITLAGLYIGGQYSQASPSELAALEWAKENTPEDAIFLEAYSLFPRVPYLAHRRIFYGGHFGPQYHGYDGRDTLEAMTGETNATLLRRKLLDAGVDYIFMGERERDLPFASELEGYEQPFPGIIRVS